MSRTTIRASCKHTLVQLDRPKRNRVVTLVVVVIPLPASDGAAEEEGVGRRRWRRGHAVGRGWRSSGTAGGRRRDGGPDRDRPPGPRPVALVHVEHVAAAASRMFSRRSAAGHHSKPLLAVNSIIITLKYYTPTS